MKKFSYTALDRDQGIQSGTIEAVDDQQAASLLRERGYIVTSLESSKPFDVSSMLSVISGVPDSILIAFTRQIATMISSGLKLSRALEILGKQIDNARMKEAV